MANHTDAACAKPLLHVAPMLEVTNPDFRYLLRLLTKRTTLWTSMLGPRDQEECLCNPQTCEKVFGFDTPSRPVVCQLGGSDSVLLAQAAAAAERHGYTEVNLNCGCPSSRVSGKGEFGISLMRNKELVRDIVHAMSRTVQIPVSVKCRLGVDEDDSQAFTADFVRTVAQSGCKHFAIHARKADLTLSPLQNRSMPPLEYHRVLDLCHQFPDITFTLNGGITSLNQAHALLGLDWNNTDSLSSKSAAAWGCLGSDALWSGVPPNLGGVMIGEAVRKNPVMLWNADRVIFGESLAPLRQNRREVLLDYCTYLEKKRASCHAQRLEPIPSFTMKLFSGTPWMRAYKTTLLQLWRNNDCKDMGPSHVLHETMQILDAQNTRILDAPFSLSEMEEPLEQQGDPEAMVECPHCGHDQNKSRYWFCHACKGHLRGT